MTALARVVGVPGAVGMGLGSILGTGIFVSIGIAAEVAGPGVVPAVALAAVVATFNGLSSAQLAASHPLSGGTYEYGYRYLSPQLGFTAGWMFLCAKSASAATAALGLAGYLLHALGAGGGSLGRTALALGTVVTLTLLVRGGMRLSSRANAAIVATTVAALAAFVAAGLPVALEAAGSTLRAATGATGAAPRPGAFLHATALMFVAYTGYGRIATLGEEIRDPGRSIPRAIVLTLGIAMALYTAVAFVATASAGPAALAEATRSTAAPLEVIARGFPSPYVSGIVAVGAVSAMLGVLLNLLLGLSRVLLAMARRGDMPKRFSTLSGGTPGPAVLASGAIVAGIALAGDVEMAWSFSAFTVLVYYALTNLAALRLPPEHRRFPRWTAAAGLASCAGLAFWVEPRIWATGLALIGVGLVWHHAARLGGRGRPDGRAP